MSVNAVTEPSGTGHSDPYGEGWTHTLTNPLSLCLICAQTSEPSQGHSCCFHFR